MLDVYALAKTSWSFNPMPMDYRILFGPADTKKLSTDFFPVSFKVSVE